MQPTAPCLEKQDEWYMFATNDRHKNICMGTQDDTHAQRREEKPRCNLRHVVINKSKTDVVSGNNPSDDHDAKQVLNKIAQTLFLVMVCSVLNPTFGTVRQ